MISFASQVYLITSQALRSVTAIVTTDMLDLVSTIRGHPNFKILS